MIDLGGELADYDDTHPAPSAAAPTLPGFVRERPGGGVTVPLADLQAQGFNRTPPPGYRLQRTVTAVVKDLERLISWPDPPTFVDGPIAKLARGLAGDPPTLTAKTWMRGDESGRP